MTNDKLQTVLDRLHGVRKSGDGHVAFCPAHADKKKRSLSIGLKDRRIVVKCFTGCSFEDIYRALGLEAKDFFFDDAIPESDIDALLGPLTIQQLAETKGIPATELGQLGLHNTPQGVVIPYYRRNMEPCPRQRLRKSLTGENSMLWLGQKGVAIEPYGLWKLDMATQEGYLILVEGESDTWSLWHYGFPALGIPGATNTKTLQLSHLEGVERLYAVQEADEGGKSFIEHISRRLHELKWDGELYVIPMPL